MLRKSLPEAPEYRKFYSVSEALETHLRVLETGKSNYEEARIEVKCGYNKEAFKLLLDGYEKRDLLLNGVLYGWPYNWSGTPELHGFTVPNHPSVERDHPLATQKWLQEQIDKGMIVGPIAREDLPWEKVTTIPLHSVVKDEVLGTR